MHVVYVIQNSSSLDVYVGQTNNLERRLKQHNNGLSKSTHRKASDGRWILVYAEAYRDKEDATEREVKLKQRGSAKHWLKRRLKRSLFRAKR